ncbi:MAG: ATP-binding protein, partial [Polyangiales bacterium]
MKKLGPLREATVDLSKRLIVLTGPNNAGKTWLAWCVYALATLPTEELAPVVKPFAEELLASPQRRLDATRSEALWKAVIDAVPAVLKRWLPIVFALPEEHFAETELGFESSANHRSLSSGFYASEDERAALLVLSVSRRQVELGVAQRTSQLLTPRTVPAIDVDVDAQLVIKQLTDSAWHILAPRALIFPAERAGIQLVARELAAER